jgi:intracellular multiplication protein IcmL
MNSNEAQVLIFSRNAFYQRMHMLMLGALSLTILVIVALSFVVYFLITQPVRPVFFATDEIGRLLDIVPISQPNMSNDDVITWASNAIESAYSYDYVNFHSQLQNAQKYFTNYGWSKYMSALSASNNLLALNKRKLVIVAQVVGPPQILAQGILGGAYAWKFQFPILVTYRQPPFDDKSQYSNALSVTVIVQRQPILQSDHGLGVVQIIAEVAQNDSNQPQELSNTPTGS